MVLPILIFTGCIQYWEPHAITPGPIQETYIENTSKIFDTLDEGHSVYCEIQNREGQPEVYLMGKRMGVEYRFWALYKDPSLPNQYRERFIVLEPLHHWLIIYSKIWGTAVPQNCTWHMSVEPYTKGIKTWEQITGGFITTSTHYRIRCIQLETPLEAFNVPQDVCE